MLGRCHQSGPHGIIVHVFQLLEHQCIAGDGLRMEPFLPDLMDTGFVGRLVIIQLIQQPITLRFGKILQDAPGGEFLEIGNHATEIGRGDDCVKMIRKDDPAE